MQLRAALAAPVLCAAAGAATEDVRGIGGPESEDNPGASHSTTAPVGAGVAYTFSKRSSVYVDAASKRYPTDTRSMYGVGLAHSF